MIISKRLKGADSDRNQSNDTGCAEIDFPRRDQCEKILPG